MVSADPELSALLTSNVAPVLAGERLLAGLSLVQLEAPSDARGVALLAPAGSAIDPGVLAALLTGLRSNPLLAPVTVDDLFRNVPAANPEITRSLVDGRPPTALPQAGAVRAARAAVDGLASIAPAAGKVLSQAERELLFATSTVAPEDRPGILARVSSAVKKAETGISLPGSTSITLTAQKGTIPLTVLSNPALHARVELRIVSQKLTFRPFATALGSCTVTDSSTETCLLTLTSEATTLRIPVETRTSGVFAMLVTLTAPNGAVTLAFNRDTVRSTAFSDVGVVLIVAAALGLVAWWVRNARHGRRARQLVDPPSDVDGVPDLEDEGSDPVISDFFASTPPEYGVSPSGHRPGPNS